MSFPCPENALHALFSAAQGNDPGGRHILLPIRRIMETKICELELKVLYEISRLIGQVLNLDQALETILGILSEASP